MQRLSVKILNIPLIASLFWSQGVAKEKSFDFFNEAGIKNCEELKEISFEELSDIEHHATRRLLRTLESNDLKCKFLKSLGYLRDWPEGDVHPRDYPTREEAYRSCGYWNVLNNKTAKEVIKHAEQLFEKFIHFEVQRSQEGIDIWVSMKDKMEDGPEKKEAEKRINKLTELRDNWKKMPFMDNDSKLTFMRVLRDTGEISPE